MTDDASPSLSMRVAVAGGTGFIGRHVVLALLRAGASVVVLARHANATPPRSGVTMREADVGEKPPDLSGCDAVVNLVGIKAPSGDNTFERAHVQAVENLAVAMASAGIRRLIHVSVVPLPETLGAYAASKSAGERLAMAADLDTTVIRPGLVIGPGDDAMTNLIRFVRLAPVFPIAAGRLGALAPVDVRDVAAAILAALCREHTIGEAIDVVGPQSLDLRSMVQRVATALSLPTFLLPVPGRLQYWAAAVFERLPGEPIVTRSQLAMLGHGLPGDTAAASQRLGVQPRALTEARIRELAETVTDFAPSVRVAPTAAHKQWLAERAPTIKSLWWFVPLALGAMIAGPSVVDNVWIRMALIEVALAALALFALPNMRWRSTTGFSAKSVAAGLAAAVALYGAGLAGFLCPMN